MKILWFLLFLHTSLAQPGFGKSYLRNSRLCHQWNCINSKLGLSDSLPPSEEFGHVLRRILPEAWHTVVDRVLNVCYNDRPRRYTNTCPGQALMHCTVDQLISYCPEESLRKDDACASVNSIAGLNYMFSQSRYENLERNIPYERRPTWFLKNYFDMKCCNLPSLVNSTTLTECGFTSMITYLTHNPKFANTPVKPSSWLQTPIIYQTTETAKADSLQVVSLKDFRREESTSESEATLDPLSCCDISGFIQPTWQQECGFNLEWRNQTRLTILDGAVTDIPTVTVKTVTHRDLVVLPQSCEKETCVFDKLNITRSGSVDVEAFKRLLDRLTDDHPSWLSAKARVTTTCLSAPSYDADCQINKVLACTFDVLSENCPNATKNDLCKHAKDDRVCQISSSKYRPKHRRGTCVVPELVEKSILRECGLNSLHRIEEVVSTMTKPKKHGLFAGKHKCLDLTPSTSCIMSKMGVLNKYGFMDYFKMKDLIRHFVDKTEWAPLLEFYLSAFSNAPLYTEHCSSAKKLLNIVDFFLMTCPMSKRKNTTQCEKTLTAIHDTPANRNVTEQFADQFLKHFHHVAQPIKLPYTPRVKYTTKIVKNPLYDYGVLSSKYVPKVKVIDVKPAVKKPLMILPVYMRIPHSNLAVRPYYNGVLRSPFGLHNQIARAHTTYISDGFSTSTLTPVTP